jgi:hypothetical protein
MRYIQLASTHVLLSRPAPATFKPGSSIRERFRSSLEPLPRRHWPSGTTLTPARRTGGGLDGFPASPAANLNTESLTASSLSWPAQPQWTTVPNGGGFRALNRAAPFRFAFLSAFSVPRSRHPRPSDARSPSQNPLRASSRCGLLSP